MHLQDHVAWIMRAHTDAAIEPSKAWRKWDTSQPYWVHPVWCAMTIATETTLDKAIRDEGVLVLLYHDIPEDTTAFIPFAHIKPRVIELIKGMTFRGGTEEEIVGVWQREPAIRLYKLYDKVHSLLTPHSGMTPATIERDRRHVAKLVTDVLSNFGPLHITRLALATLAAP